MQGAMCQGAGVRLIPAAGGVGLLGEEGSTRHPWDPWFAAPRASAAPPWVWRCLRPCCRAAWCWDVPVGAAQDGDVPAWLCGAGSPPVPHAGLGTAGPRLGRVSHRRTLPSISQPPPRGTIHLHSIFTPLHMFPFQPRIIFYHQITAAIRWSRCDSEQSSRPPLSPPALLASPPLPPSLLAAHRQGVIQMSGGLETPGGRICWLRTNLSRQRAPGCAVAPPGSLRGAPLLRHHRPAAGAPSR